MVERRQGTGRVSTRSLDLDHLRPQIGEDLAAQYPFFIAEIEHAVAGHESAALGWCRHPSRAPFVGELYDRSRTGVKQ